MSPVEKKVKAALEQAMEELQRLSTNARQGDSQANRQAHKETLLKTIDSLTSTTDAFLNYLHAFKRLAKEEL